MTFPPTHEARSRAVYLPNGAKWYDLWTGAEVAAGQTIDAPAPYDAIPVHVRAGSIVGEQEEVEPRTDELVALYCWCRDWAETAERLVGRKDYRTGHRPNHRTSQWSR